MLTGDQLHNIDDMIMLNICADIANGILLTEADNETVYMLLCTVYEDKEYYTERGVTIGEA
jgi:hypothetical protein